jgi:hypothetical protein
MDPFLEFLQLALGLAAARALHQVFCFAFQGLHWLVPPRSLMFGDFCLDSFQPFLQLALFRILAAAFGLVTGSVGAILRRPGSPGQKHRGHTENQESEQVPAHGRLLVIKWVAELSPLS